MQWAVFMFLLFLFLVEGIKDIVGWKGEIILIPPDFLPEAMKKSQLCYLNLDQNLITDSSRIRNELGFNELVSSLSGLVKTIEWQRLNPPNNLRDQFNYNLEDGPVLIDHVIGKLVFKR
jgi:hypothetical protein